MTEKHLLFLMINYGPFKRKKYSLANKCVNDNARLIIVQRLKCKGCLIIVISVNKSVQRLSQSGTDYKILLLSFKSETIDIF